MIITEHIKFVLNEKIELMQVNQERDAARPDRLNSYDEGYLDALDFVLNLIEAEESERQIQGGSIMNPWYMEGEVSEQLIHASHLVEDGQIDDAICACLSVGMSDEEIDEFLSVRGVAA